MGEYLLGTGITITETFMLNGVPTDPTTVTFYLRDPHDDLTTYIFGVDAEITNPAVGVYKITLTPTLVGHFNYRVEGTGAVVAVCEGDFDVLPSPTLTILPQGIEYGPCTSWVDGGDVAECCNTDVGSDTGLLSAAALTASQLLFELSARQYAGTCQKTVRPCATSSWCGVQVLSRGHIVNWGGDSWGSGGGNSSICGCAPLSRIWLSGYPVTSITEVLIDGVVVNPDTYELREWRYLDRMRDPADPGSSLTWPSCQQLDLPDTEVGTFSVTYLYGADPPLAGQEAAKQLACNIYLACVGSDQCQLPLGATRITRNGLTIERQFLARDPQTGVFRTGLTLVDAFLNTYNPSGLRRRAAFWSADAPKYGRPVRS